MTALDRFIDDLVNDRVPEDDFPKNDSSWEELFDFGARCLDEIVTLRRKAAQQSVSLTALRRRLALSLLFNVVLLTVALATISVYAIFYRAECNAKTENMGFAHRWSLLGGCQIEVVEGQWIPLENYYFKQD